MSTVRHVNGDGSHLAPSVMSVNRIQQRELFDDDDDDDDNRASAARAAGDNDNDDVTDDDVCILSSPAHSSSTSRCCVDNSFRNIVTMALLTLVNLLNYMDRFSVAGVLDDVQNYYVINNKEASLVSTAFIISYMLLSPIFGYLGDRCNRTVIMTCGIIGWSAITLASSFVSRQYFWLFVVLRALVGVGEASYSTVAPTIIADIFAKTARTRALMVFYFAIPVGSGLGYIAGAFMAEAFGGWQWALRLTPGLGVICAVLIFLLVREPVRGSADHGTQLQSTSWGEDLKCLLRHKSFMLSSAGFTCVAFVSGALALWAPEYMIKSMRIESATVDETSVSLTFGAITCTAGIVGVAVGSFSASRLRRVTSKADPLVCAFGLLTSAPFLFFSLFLSCYNTTVTWILILVGETLLFLNWALVADILLYVVIPTRRSTAEAVQILLSHLLGDAGSPFLVGIISDAVKGSYAGREDNVVEYVSMQSALFMTCFACALGGGFFLLTAVFIDADRARTDQITHGLTVDCSLVDSGFVNDAVAAHSDDTQPLDT